MSMREVLKGMGDGGEFEGVMLVCMGRHCRETYWCRRSHGGWRNSSAASTKGLCGHWRQDTRNPGLLGLPDAQKVSKDISKDLNNKYIPFHAHERAVQRADT